MPIPQSKIRRLSVYWFVVIGLLLTSQLSFGFRWLTPSDWQVDFGKLPVGKNLVIPEILTNTGRHPVTVQGARLSTSGFRVFAASLPKTLQPGQSVKINLVFVPTKRAAYSGTLAIPYGLHGLVMQIGLTGTGTAVSATVAAAPPSVSFGSVKVGSSLTKTGTLSATGSSAVVSSVTTTNPEFTISGITLPLTVQPGKSIPFSVRFTPQTAGSASAKLSFAGQGGSMATQTLAGSGAAASVATHSVNLSWRASTSAVMGYNVYRGTASGGPYNQINVSLDKALAFTDSTVKGGETYFYVLTAVDGSGNESPHSNQAAASVPGP